MTAPLDKSLAALPLRRGMNDPTLALPDIEAIERRAGIALDRASPIFVFDHPARVHGDAPLRRLCRELDRTMGFCRAFSVRPRPRRGTNS
jgi:hypothetical protein